MHEYDTPRTRVDQWLAALGAPAGLSLRLDDEGVCAIGHASGIDCAIEVPERGGSVYLRAPLMPWPPGQAQRIAEYCLEAQFLGLSTDGASLAIDPQDRELVLWQSMPLAVLGSDALARLVIGFINAAARWRDELAGMDATPAGPREPSIAASPVGQPAALRAAGA